MNENNYDAAVIRWFDCVAQGSHRFNSAGTCMYCGVLRRGPTVTIRGGVMPRREKTK